MSCSERSSEVFFAGVPGPALQRPRFSGPFQPVTVSSSSLRSSIVTAHYQGHVKPSSPPALISAKLSTVLLPSGCFPRVSKAQMLQIARFGREIATQGRAGQRYQRVDDRGVYALAVPEQ